MKSKNTILVIVVLLVCGTFYWFMLREDAGRHQPKVQRPFAAVEASSWQRLEFAAPEKKPVTLVKKDDRWQVEGMEKCEVKTEMVEHILAALQELRLDSLVTSGKEKFADYQVDEQKGIRVHGIAAGKPMGLVVGKVAADFMHTYVRLEGDQHIFRVNGLIGHLFAHDPADFCQEKDEKKKESKDSPKPEAGGKPPVSPKK